jgi:fido (protein-threonine AMPylation protein)
MWNDRMARPKRSEATKLALALEELHAKIGPTQGVVRGQQIKNATRVLLLEKGFLREILKGWYFVSDPGAHQGDSTLFYANFWEYLAYYLEDRFGAQYCLSAESSLLRHSQCNVIPRQIQVLLGVNQSQIQDLVFGHSLVMYPGQKSMPTEEQVVLIDGLRCMSLPYCLIKLPPRLYQTWQKEIQIVLGTLADPGAIAVLVETSGLGISRVVASLRQVGRKEFAERIERELAGSGFHLPQVKDPFEPDAVYQLQAIGKSPLYARVQLLWKEHREEVLAMRPTPPPAWPEIAFLQQVEAAKLEDAYHSLSIERYRVTPELIARVAAGQWHPDGHPADREQTEAMAARGYLDAFELVKQDAVAAFRGESTAPGLAARLFSDHHQEWFQALFGPSVTAGILKRSDLIGYRRHLVFLRGSSHVPPHFESLRYGMEALQESLAEETDAFVRAVLGHWLFGFIHPYADGNGRMARFTMNLLLASGGYPWTILQVEERERYMADLESASVQQNIGDFARFIAWNVEKAVANLDLRSVADK